MFDELESLFPSPTGQNPSHGKQMKSAKRIADKMFDRITKKSESEIAIKHIQNAMRQVGEEIEDGPCYQGIPIIDIVLNPEIPEPVAQFLRALLLVKG